MKNIELYIYNFGIEKALLLNKNHKLKNYINTTSVSLLFAIFYSRFNIVYFSDNISISNYYLYKIIIIQRKWRNVLKYRINVKKETIEKGITLLLEKINTEINGEPAKNVLIYLVNKFRQKLCKTL